MARAKMTDLKGLLTAQTAVETSADPSVGEQEAGDPVGERPAARPSEETASQPSPDTRSASAGPAQPKRGTRPRRVENSAPTPSLPPGTPRYKTLVRKELRITPNQADQLSSIARALNLTRNGEGERITDNTLVRVAIGLLLERAGELSGRAETELFRSLGLDPAE